MRRCSTWYIGNCKLEWHIILHLLEWPESEYQILLRMRINRNSINTLIDWGMQNGIATSGNSLADYYKSEKKKKKNLLPYDPAIVLLGIYPNELKTCPYKNLHLTVYGSFIHNC